MASVNSYYSHPHVEAQLYPSYDAARQAGYGYSYEEAMKADGYSPGLGYLGYLGGFEDNLKRVFNAIPGASGAYNDLVLLIQAKAKEGAEQAIPRIKSEVESTVKPFVIAALLLGFGGFLFGISTYLQNRRA